MSGVKPLAYVPGQDAKLDALAERYRELNARPEALAPDPGAGEERTTSDPFGFARAAAPPPKSDPWLRAKRTAEDLVQFLNLLIAQGGLTPEEAFYAQELMSLNTLNAPDVPLDPKRRAEVRKAAYDYYAAHRPR